ncbi:hypothetical protein Gotur_001408, partial [Gossypium turneri]
MSGQQEEDKKPGDQSAAHINLKVKGQVIPFNLFVWVVLITYMENYADMDGDWLVAKTGFCYISVLYASAVLGRSHQFNHHVWSPLISVMASLSAAWLRTRELYTIYMWPLCAPHLSPGTWWLYIAFRHRIHQKLRYPGMPPGLTLEMACLTAAWLQTLEPYMIYAWPLCTPHLSHGTWWLYIAFPYGIHEKGGDGNEVFFRIKRSTQLKKLMNAYCDRQSVDFNSIAFLFDGRRLRGEQTPDELEMEDGDEIDAMLHQTGGTVLVDLVLSHLALIEELEFLVFT